MNLSIGSGHRGQQVLRSDLRDCDERQGDVATGVCVSCVAVGVILLFGVANVVGGLGLAIVGLILMVGGGIGMVVSDLAFSRAPRDHIANRTDERTRVG